MLAQSSKYQHDLGGKYETLSHAQRTAVHRSELDYTVNSIEFLGLVGITSLSQEAMDMRKVAQTDRARQSLFKPHVAKISVRQESRQSNSGMQWWSTFSACLFRSLC